MQGAHEVFMFITVSAILLINLLIAQLQLGHITEIRLIQIGSLYII